MRLLHAHVLILTSVLLGCTPQYRSNFAQLKDGMTQDQVRELLGKPSVVVPPRTDVDGTVLRGARWQYGDNLSTWTTSAVFPDTEPDRVWIVWFDPQGRLIGSQSPSWLKPAGENADTNSQRNDILEPFAPPPSR